MRIVSYIFIVILGLGMTSCFDLIERVDLNKNGTGSYTITADFSRFFEDEFVKEILLNRVTEEEDLDEFEIDSTLYFADLLADYPAGTLTEIEKEVMGKGQMSIQINLSENYGSAVVLLPFNDVAEIGVFQNVLDRLKEETGRDGIAAIFGSNCAGFTNSNFSLNGRTLSREQGEMTLSFVEKADYDQFDELYAAATFQIIYNLPAEVRKTSIKGANKEDDEVIVTYSFGKFINERPDIGGEIKFKKN